MTASQPQLLGPARAAWRLPVCQLNLPTAKYLLYLFGADRGGSDTAAWQTAWMRQSFLTDGCGVNRRGTWRGLSVRWVTDSKNQVSQQEAEVAESFEHLVNWLTIRLGN